METVKKIKNKIESVFKKGDFSALKTWDGSGFYLNNIGPEIAKLITLVEGVNYYYKTVNYNGVNYFTEHYGLDTVYYNGKCSIVTNKDDLRIEEKGHVGSFFDGKDTVCLATTGFELPPKFYDGKIYRTPRLDPPNNKIHFYDDNENKIVLFKEFPYVYDFIDLAIKKQAESSSLYLSRMEYNELIEQVVETEMAKRNQIEEPMQRKRVQ